MKNLIISLTTQKCVTKEPQLCCIALENLYILSEYSIFTAQSSDLVCNLENILIAENKTGSVPVSFDFCSLTENLVVAFASGDLVQVGLETGCGQFSGCIEPGIAAAAWSPGEDLFAVVSDSSNLLIFSADIDEPIVETDLMGKGEEESVSVGWGKKETQFRGKEGKLSAAQPVAQAPNLTFDDGKVRVSWRGDGECLAVSMRVDGQRCIKVINREGMLLHRSETTPGLESALAWRPSGNLIATSERLPNKHMVSFFEKNTLPHGGFALSGDWTVREILWSCDSNILAAVLKGETQVIRLFTCGNYHWYHKYSIPIDKDENIMWVAWDKVETGLLHVVTAGKGDLNHYRYLARFASEASSGASATDQALAAVIDGPRLLLTAFRVGIVPPPMSTSTIDCTQPINGVTFLQYGAEGNSNDFLIQLMDDTVLVYKYSQDTRKHTQVAERTFPNVFQLFWVSEDIVLGLRGGGRRLEVLKLSDEEFRGHVELESAVSAVKRLPGRKKALLCSDVEFQSLDLETLEVDSSDLKAPAKSGKLLNMEVRRTSNKNDLTILLDSAHRLYADSNQIANNATSMRVHEDMLLVTTLQHKLLCWSLDGLQDAAAERPIERGARVVTSVPGCSKVVLQLPRGNLEVVQPRALSLSVLKRDLSSQRYAEAYSVMRRERINLNLLHDHDPQLFIANVDRFVDVISDSVLFCNFIAELSPDNVTTTMFSAFYSQQSDLPDKVTKVCSLLLTAIEKRPDRSNYFLAELSCLVKKGDIESALLQIKESTGKRQVAGLKHLLYLVDIDHLFKVALGTYDFDLVMFIAKNSQKDPKEYLPFIAQLKTMEENFRKFTIDKFLKRHEKAVEHLSRCPDRLQDCLEFTVTHSLYDRAMRLFPEGTDGFKSVCVKYAEDLTRQKRHNEAGDLYLRAGQHNLALFAFTRSGAWRQVIGCAQTLEFTDDQMVELVTSLADSLRTEKRFEDAGRLLIEYGGDVSGSVAAFCAAQMLEEACRIARLHRAEDMVDSVVKPAAISAQSNLLETITQTLDTIKQQTLRLDEVRKRRQEDGVEIDWDDSASDSSYGSSKGSSKGSRATTGTRSAKNARKLERKLLSLKEGGPFEDVALIASLHDLISQLGSLKTAARSLNQSLKVLGELSKAAELQKALKLALDVATGHIPEIWKDEGVSVASEFGVHSTSNSIAAAFSGTNERLPAVVQALQPKILSPPDVCADLEWEFASLNLASS